MPGLAPGTPAPAGERDAPCPYIRTGVDEDPTDEPNVADIEGNRIHRTTVLTGLRPAGCRFYFINPPYQATADIQPFTYATAAAAHDQMVRIARAGRHQIGRPAFGGEIGGSSRPPSSTASDGARRGDRSRRAPPPGRMAL